MVRTQIYLSTEERDALRNLARRTGKKQSELIRQAIDAFLSRFQPENRQSRLQQARGMWRDRADLPDFAALRRELDRLAGNEA